MLLKQKKRTGYRGEDLILLLELNVAQTEKTWKADEARRPR
jgi:hypothetical protein